MTNCACGQPADSGSERNECAACFRDRLGSVRSGFAPTRSLGSGKMLGADRSRQFSSRLDDYAKVRKEGSQPASTKRVDIDRAKAASDHVNAPVDAGPYARTSA